MFARIRPAAAALLLPLLLAIPAQAQCREDVSKNGVVDVADVLLVIGAWGKCDGACPADMNDDGFVDVADLLGVLAAWGPCLFEYPDYEDEFAELVGIDFVGSDGPLTLDQDVYDRVVRDMGLITDGWPQLVGGGHFGSWVPYQMLLVMDQSVPRDDFERRVAYFQAEIVREYFDGLILLVGFPSGINIPAVLPLFQELPSVESAEPNSYIQLPVGTPGWFGEDIGQGALQWKVVVPWLEGQVCDFWLQRCACWSRHMFVITAEGELTLLDVESGCYRECIEDCDSYR